MLDDSGARDLGADRWRLWRRLATAARAAVSGLAERVTPALEWAPGTSGRAVGYGERPTPSFTQSVFPGSRSYYSPW